MKISSDLFTRFLRATGRMSDPTSDGDIEILNVLVPVIIVPGPVRAPTPLIATEVQRETFSFEFGRTQGVSAAAGNTDVLRLGRGLWLCMINFQHHADFTSAPGAVGAALTLLDDVAADNALVRFPNIANVSQVLALNFRLLVPVDNWGFNLVTGATGVGQTMHNSVDGLISRIN